MPESASTSISLAFFQPGRVLVGPIIASSNFHTDDGIDFCMPPTAGELDIVDLGCGNGVLGLMAARQNPRARIYLVDESYMAIETSRINFSQLTAEPGRASFYCSDGLTEFAPDSADLVLCNPPFHQQHSVADTIALSMFKQSARVLRPGGELWVIGNRHLGYHNKLRRWFADVELVASNAKFVILKARVE